MKINEMNEQELVFFAMDNFLQNACNIHAIAQTFIDVTRRLRQLNINGNDHIAQKWIIDKLYSLVGRTVAPKNIHEEKLVNNYYLAQDLINYGVKNA